MNEVLTGIDTRVAHRSRGADRQLLDERTESSETKWRVLECVRF